MNGEKDLFLIRVERSRSAILVIPGALGTVTVLTVCSGREAAKAYIDEERAAGPCRVWIAALGDIPEHRFVEQTS